MDGQDEQDKTTKTGKSGESSTSNSPKPTFERRGGFSRTDEEIQNQGEEFRMTADGRSHLKVSLL